MNRKPFLVRWRAAFAHFRAGLWLKRFRDGDSAVVRLYHEFMWWLAFRRTSPVQRAALQRMADEGWAEVDMQKAMDSLDAELKRAGIEPPRRIVYNKDGVPR